MKISPFSPFESVFILTIIASLGMHTVERIHERQGTSDGQRDAAADIEAGHLGLKFGGKPAAWNTTAIRLFRERYGIEVQFNHACCPTPYQACYAKAYNEQLSRKIKEVRGEISIDQVFEDARKEWTVRASHSSDARE